MADDLARFNAEPAPQEFLDVSDENIKRLFRALQIGAVNKDLIHNSTQANLYLERFIRASVTFIAEEVDASGLSPERQEIISEHLFRRLGDLSSTIDNLRLIAEDLQNMDLDGILARYEGRV